MTQLETQTAPDRRRAAAFFSYVRADDDHDRGRLTEIRRALAAEVSTQLGFDFLIFQDRHDILWGQRWRERIEESIDGSTALIVVLTPRLFRSTSCREEIERFQDRETRLGRHDLIFPLYYVDIPGWGSDNEEDHLIREMATRQYYDWRELRFEPLDNPSIRRTIADLSRQLVAAVTRVPEGATETLTVAEPVESDAIGFMELVAGSEDTMPLFLQTLADLNAEMEKLAEIAIERAAQMEKAKRAPKPTVAQLMIMRELAAEYGPSAERFEALAADYAEQLERVDGGISALIERIPSVTDEQDAVAARDFAGQIRTLNEQTLGAFSGLNEFRTSLEQLRQQSSTIRPVLGRIDHTLELILSSGTVFERWLRSIDQAVSELEQT